MKNKIPPLIILAAGKSSRMGHPKGLIEVGNKSLIKGQIDSYFSANGSEVIVVLGHVIKKYQNHLKKQNKCQFAINLNPDLGMFSSLVTGLNCLSGLPAFIMPVDTPPPESQVWEKLYSFYSGQDAIIPTYKNKGGHPILLSSKFIDRLKAMPLDREDSRLDRQLQHADVLRIEVDDFKIAWNINSKIELEKFLSL